MTSLCRLGTLKGMSMKDVESGGDETMGKERARGYGKREEKERKEERSVCGDGRDKERIKTGTRKKEMVTMGERIMVESQST